MAAARPAAPVPFWAWAVVEAEVAVAAAWPKRLLQVLTPEAGEVGEAAESHGCSVGVLAAPESLWAWVEAEEEVAAAAV